MKRIAVLLSVAATLVVLAAPLAAQTTARANVPFEFQVGERILPPGEYTVGQLDSYYNGIIKIVGSDAGVLAPTLNGAPPQAADANKVQLVFHRYGSHYFLAKIVNGYRNRTTVLPESKQERTMVASASRHEQIIILAKL